MKDLEKLNHRNFFVFKIDFDWIRIRILNSLHKRDLVEAGYAKVTQAAAIKHTPGSMQMCTVSRLIEASGNTCLTLICILNFSTSALVLVLPFFNCCIFILTLLP